MAVHSSSLQSSNFRLDINGLRAWAVLAVVFYHFGVPGFAGGFVGVDVFFVISGYLMARIISRGLEGGGFSFWAFYASRIKRIVPALLFMCALLLVLGWFCLAPADYSQLVADMRAALVFLSNVNFARSTGYFATDSHEKWLLHTWSLCVEWQFYLLFPLVLFWVWRWRPQRKTLLWTCGLLATISFASACYFSEVKPRQAFFLLPSRAWELLAGSLVFLCIDGRAWGLRFARSVEILGLFLIGVSITFLSTSVLWPAPWALLPVIGAVLVLVASRNDSFWTANSLAQWLGKTSYSLYLWHWPVVVTLIYLKQQNNSYAIILGIIISLFLGWASWKWVESFLQNLVKSDKCIIVLLFVFSGIFIGGASIVYAKNGFESRLPQAVANFARGALDRNPRRDECHKENLPQPGCTYGGAELGALVIGDSHAESIVRTVEAALPEKMLHVLDWSLSACPTIMGMKGLPGRYTACPDFVPQVLQQSKILPSAVPLIVMNRLSAYPFGEHAGEQDEFLRYFFGNAPVRLVDRDEAYLQQFRLAFIDTICAFAKTRPVYLVRPIPEMPVDVPKSVGSHGGRFLWGSEIPDISLSLSAYHKRQAWAWEVQDAAVAQCGAKVLDPLPYLCWDGRCHGVKDDKALYFDDDHLSETGARLLLPLFQSVFADPTHTAIGQSTP